MNNHNFYITNSDTDAVSFKKPDGSIFTKEEQQSLIYEINSLLPDMIEYEDDGIFDKFLVLKAKNYVLVEGDKISKKGSAITDSKKEPALQEMIDKLIQSLLNKETNQIEIFELYVKEALNITDIRRWAVKKNITKSVLNPSRVNEQKVLDALEDEEYQEGDKKFMFYSIDGQIPKISKGEVQYYKDGTTKMVDNKILKLVENWENSEDEWHYVKRCYNTVEIFKKVLDLDQFIKYHNKGNHAKALKL
jgi:hypothetical protein